MRTAQASTGQANRQPPAPDNSSPETTILRLPELDATGIPGRRLLQNALAFIFTISAALGLALALAVSLVTLEITVGGAGTLEPTRVWPVRARAAGMIVDVMVRTGDTVTAGQALIRLDTVNGALRLAQLDAQAAAQKLEQERLPRTIAIERRTAEIALAQAKARALKARATMRERLVDFGLGQNVDSVLGSYRRGTHVGLDAAIADVESAQADVAAARTQLANIDLAHLDIRRQALEERRLDAAVEEGRLDLAQRVLLAPAAGIVLTDLPERLIGTEIGQGSTAIEIGDLDHWHATISVMERDIHRVRVGDPAVVDIPAIAVLRDEPVNARVVSVAAVPFGDGQERETLNERPPATAPGAYRVTLELDRDQLDSLGLGIVRRGYGVRAKIVTRRARAIVLVKEWLREKLRSKV